MGRILDSLLDKIFWNFSSLWRKYSINPRSILMFGSLLLVSASELAFSHVSRSLKYRLLAQNGQSQVEAPTACTPNPNVYKSKISTRSGVDKLCDFKRVILQLSMRLHFFSATGRRPTRAHGAGEMTCQVGMERQNPMLDSRSLACLMDLISTIELKLRKVIVTNLSRRAIKVYLFCSFAGPRLPFVPFCSLSAPKAIIKWRENCVKGAACSLVTLFQLNRFVMLRD